MTGSRSRRQNGPALIGRAAELDTARRALTVHGRHVAVTGDPGIGKTAMLDRLAADLAEQGWLCLVGRGRAATATQPYGIFADALADYLDGPGPRIDGLEPRNTDGAVLGGVFPALNPLREGPATLVSDERIRAATRHLLGRYAARRRLVVVLDDLHLADPQSIELLTFLLEHPPAGNVRLLLASRQRQHSASLAWALARASDQRNLTALQLEPLDDETSGALLGERCKVRFTPYLHGAAGGNPGVLLALATGPEHPGWQGARSAMLAELAGLDPFDIEVARGGAAAGTYFTPELVAEAIVAPVAAVLAALDRLFARDIVRSLDPPWFQFRHPLLCAVIQDGTPPGARVAAHQRIDALLAKRGAAPVERAPHVLITATPGEPGAAEVLLAAADARAGTDPAKARQWAEAANRLRGGTGTAERRSIGALATRTGPVPPAAALLTTLLDDMADDDPHRPAVTTDLARLLLLDGAHDRADVLLRTGVTSHRLRLEAAHLSAARGDWASARIKAEPLVSGDPDAQAWAAAIVARSAAASGAPDAARMLIRARRLTDRLRGHPSDLVTEAVLAVGWAALDLDAPASALQSFSEARDRASGIGRSHLLAEASAGCALGSVATAAVPAARDAVAEAEHLAQAADSAHLRLLAALARFHVERWTTADGPDLSGQELVDTAERVGGAWATTAYTTALLAGCTDTSALLARLGGEQLPGLPLAVRARYFALRAATHAERDELDDARLWAAEVAALGPVEYGALAEAYVLHASGSPAAAAELHTQVADGFLRQDRRLAAATACRSAARSHAAAGNLPAVLDSLGLARKLLEEHGATELAAQTRREQRRTAALIRHSRSSRAAVTTGRESQIIELVRLGFTNQQIATRLFVSVRTVEAHLSEIYHRLGVTSRIAMLGAIAERTARRAEAGKVHQSPGAAG